ncbi:MAG: helix-hairpin-helix domain-containing protein [Puniceicoccaceae bacterium]
MSLINRFHPPIWRLQAFILFLLLAPTLLVAQEPLQAFPGSQLLLRDWADGDSFLVRIEPEREITVRLYFVDCPETSVNRDSDRRRLLAQSRYFGVPNPATTLHFGKQARLRTIELLSDPFTVHTAFADAMGRSGYQRYYAFIQLADGRDLGEVLVREGLARVFGVGRTNYRLVPTALQREHLADLELVAAANRRGIWEATDFDLLAELRAVAREEDQFLRSLGQSTATSSGPAPGQQIDPNTATHGELTLLPGIGEVLADRILDARPFHSIDDLGKVQGIGSQKLDRIRPFLTLTPPRSEPES